jgi:MFS family permease
MPDARSRPTPGAEPAVRYGALSFREFRLLCLAQLTADFAANLQFFAVNWHVFELLHGSALTVRLFGVEISLSGAAAGLGGVGLVRLVPIVLFGILGGLVADALDRRRVMLWTRLGVAVIAFLLLAVTAVGGTGLGLLYFVSAATAALTAFDTPARHALVPLSVPPRHLSHAISLYSLAFRVSAIGAPLAGAVLIERFSLAAAYAAMAASFAVPAWCVWATRLSRPGDAPRVKPGMAAFLEGLDFVRGRKVLWASFLADFFTSCFTSVTVLLPILAEVVFDAGVGGYGLLAAGQPLGAAVTGLALTYWHRLRRQGPLLIGCLAAYGAAAALVGVSGWIYLAFALLTVMGGVDTTSSMIRSLMRQELTPDALRGRVSSIALVFFRGGPRIGEMQAGLAAAMLGAPWAIVLGGVATMAATALVVWRMPQLLRYDSIEAEAGPRGGDA